MKNFSGLIQAHHQPLEYPTHLLLSCEQKKKLAKQAVIEITNYSVFANKKRGDNLVDKSN